MEEKEGEGRRKKRKYRGGIEGWRGKKKNSGQEAKSQRKKKNPDKSRGDFAESTSPKERPTGDHKTLEDSTFRLESINIGTFPHIQDHCRLL